MDLTKQPPRSPYEQLGGITFLPRTIDKMRAHIAGTVGEYRATSGFSTQLFDLFGVTPEEFEEIVKANETDEQILKVLMERRPLGPREIDEFNQRAMNWPHDETGKARHRKLLEEAGFGHRTDIETMFDRLDLDDGREVPVGGRHKR